MQNNTSKILATILTIILLGTICIPTLTYASSEMRSEETSEENVLFNATIQNGYEAKLNILGESSLDMSLAVKNTGYLKDIKVTLEGNNYEIETTKQAEQSLDILTVTDEKSNEDLASKLSVGTIGSTLVGTSAEQGATTEQATPTEQTTAEQETPNETIEETTNPNVVEPTNQTEETKVSEETLNRIKAINGNVIELNEIKSGEIANIRLPIRFKSSEEITVEDYNKESTVTFSAIYVNEKGKERKIEKKITHKIEWTLDIEEKIEQKLTRYLKYNQNTMIGMEVKEKVEPSNMPVINKEIRIITPKINNKNPDKIIAMTEGATYNYENGILTITEQNNPDENGKIKINPENTYKLTYIYNSQEEKGTIETSATSTITTAKGDKIEGQTTENTYNVQEEIGSIVDIETELPEKLNKGYMFTNLNKAENKLATQYEEKYNVNFGLAELVDNIIIEQQSSNINSENQSYDITDKIITKKIKVENLEQILGAEGQVTIKNKNNETIATLNKEKTEVELSETTITIETTKPIVEGTLKLTLSKEISGDQNFNIDELKSLTTLNTTINVKGFKDNTEISNIENKQQIKLENPTSTATLEVSQNTLSTVVENKDVIFNVVLNKSKIENALYKNPTVKITLPEQVTNIKVKEARVLYEDEISAGSINVDKNEIKVDLLGTQTEYSSSATEEGALIRILADIQLDNLATSNDGIIKLNYENQATGESNTLEGIMKVEAPTGFVTTNTIKIGDTEVTAVEQNMENIELRKIAEERTMNIKGTIVNNLGSNAEGLTILGRIPFKGNKTIGGQNLGTTVDTKMSSAITVTGLENATIYYSEDGEAKVEDNTWTTERTENTKSYKIVANGALNDRTQAEFSYDVTIPANLPNGSIIKHNYGVYYNNNSVEGVKANLVESKIIGLKTIEGIQNIETKMVVYNTNTIETIENEGEIKEGDYLSFGIIVENKGTTNITNTEIQALLPKGLTPIKLSNGTDMDSLREYVVDTSKNATQKTISLIKPGEKRSVIFDVLVAKTINEIQEYISNFKVTINNDKEHADILECKLKCIEGSVNLKITTDIQYDYIYENQEFNYMIDLKNVNAKEKNNIVLKMQLPKGIEFLSIEENKEFQKCSYDKNTNIVTINIDKMNGLSQKRFLLTAKITTNKQEELETIATAICDENKGEVKSNKLILGTSSVNDNVTATQRLSVESGKIMDTDTIEIYVDVTNNSNGTLELIFKDSVPKELKVESCKAVIDGETKREVKSNYIQMGMFLGNGKTGRFIITAKARTQAKDKTVTIENIPTLSTTEGQTINLNSVQIQIQGTGDYTSNQGGQTSNTTHSIQGTAWLDINNNGKKEPSEERISGVNLQIYDSSKGELIKDTNGNNITATTDNSGSYTFTNLKSGKYNIVATYDNKKYDLGIYKASGIEEGENSDFILATLEGKEVASTDAITVSNSNIYNIDLALVDKNTFDLKLDKTVSKIVVTNSKTNKSNTYEYNTNVAKVELGGRDIQYNTVLVEYKIAVSNVGHVAGYAKSIVDYIPKEMTFNSELNNTWYIDTDGNAYNTSLANTIINPGETKEITLVLSKKITGENLGTVRNTAEIASSYNEYSIKDINSEAGNKQDGENDMSSADAIIGVSTGRELAKVTGITIGILALIALAVYQIRKLLMPKFKID